MTDEGKPYRMSLNHPITEEVIALFSDENADRMMFRIVVKNTLTRGMAQKLVRRSFRLSGFHGLFRNTSPGHDEAPTQVPPHPDEALLIRQIARIPAGFKGLSGQWAFATTNRKSRIRSPGGGS